jgi:hypothetical protein
MAAHANAWSSSDQQPIPLTALPNAPGVVAKAGQKQGIKRLDGRTQNQPDIKKRRGQSPAAISWMTVKYQRSSCNTPCCDWLASDSAETAIDWRVDSAWLLAASTLVSAKVRLDEPVCSTLIRFLLKS